jgi:uncharacterized protein YwqG
MNNFFGRLFGKKEGVAPMRDVSALVTPLATPAIHLVRNSLPSLSHFGGSPQLPPDIAWPLRDGVKLGFLARLSLAEIQDALPIDWLPKSGALLFFYDIEKQPWGFDPQDRGSWSVLMVPDLAAPTEQLDEGPNGNESPFPHRNVSFRRIEVLPSWERDTMRALSLTEEESDECFNISDIPFNELPKHQIAGFPAPVQGDSMELESQLVSSGLYCGDSSGYNDPRVPSLTPGAANWRLLLQIDSDDDLGVMWGDCGTIYYWVEANEAKSGNFANTWLVLQCS